jgi:peptidoglycan/LPS O-acetylase OafA/YrhL
MAIVWRAGFIGRLNFVCAIWLGLTISIKLLQSIWPSMEILQWLWQGLLLPYAPFFSIGMLAYNLSRDRSNLLSHSLILIAMALVFASGNPFRAIVTGSMTLILVSIAHGFTRNWRLPTFLIFLGEGSYCLYLFHQALGHHTLVQLNKWIAPNPVAAVIFAILMCITVGMTMHVLVEKPLAKQAAKWRSSSHSKAF